MVNRTSTTLELSDGAMDAESRDRMVRLNALLQHYTSTLNDQIRDSTLAASDLEEELRHVFEMPRDGCYGDTSLRRFYSAIRRMINEFSRLGDHIRSYQMLKESILRRMEEITWQSP